MTFNATLKGTRVDAEGESVVQFTVPLEDLSTIAKLSEGAVVTVDVE